MALFGCVSWFLWRWWWVDGQGRSNMYVSRTRRQNGGGDPKPVRPVLSKSGLSSCSVLLFKNETNTQESVLFLICLLVMMKTVTVLRVRVPRER